MLASWNITNVVRTSLLTPHRHDRDHLKLIQVVAVEDRWNLFIEKILDGRGHIVDGNVQAEDVNVFI